MMLYLLNLPGFALCMFLAIVVDDIEGQDAQRGGGPSSTSKDNGASQERQMDIQTKKMCAQVCAAQKANRFHFDDGRPNIQTFLRVWIQTVGGCEGKFFVDVGAHGGQDTQSLVRVIPKYCDPETRYSAHFFEPDPQNFKNLARVVQSLSSSSLKNISMPTNINNFNMPEDVRAESWRMVERIEVCLKKLGAPIPKRRLLPVSSSLPRRVMAAYAVARQNPGFVQVDEQCKKMFEQSTKNGLSTSTTTVAAPTPAGSPGGRSDNSRRFVAVRAALGNPPVSATPAVQEMYGYEAGTEIGTLARFHSSRKLGSYGNEKAYASVPVLSLDWLYYYAGVVQEDSDPPGSWNGNILTEKAFQVQQEEEIEGADDKSSTSSSASSTDYKGTRTAPPACSRSANTSENQDSAAARDSVSCLGEEDQQKMSTPRPGGPRADQDEEDPPRNSTEMESSPRRKMEFAKVEVVSNQRNHLEKNTSSIAGTQQQHLLALSSEEQGTFLAAIQQYADAERVIDFLKIDVEGFEEYVLNGALSLLQQGRIPVLVYECHTMPDEDQSPHPKLPQGLAELQYDIWAVHAARMYRLEPPYFHDYYDWRPAGRPDNCVAISRKWPLYRKLLENLRNASPHESWFARKSTTFHNLEDGVVEEKNDFYDKTGAYLRKLRTMAEQNTPLRILDLQEQYGKETVQKTCHCFAQNRTIGKVERFYHKFVY